MSRLDEYCADDCFGMNLSNAKVVVIAKHVSIVLL